MGQKHLPHAWFQKITTSVLTGSLYSRWTIYLEHSTTKVPVIIWGKCKSNLIYCIYFFVAVVCPVDNYNTFSLTNGPNSVSPTTSVPFGDMLTINCKVNGKTDFTKERKCIYNMTSDSYYLYGNDYECGG